jgi:hypothetical protein
MKVITASNATSVAPRSALRAAPNRRFERELHEPYLVVAFLKVRHLQTVPSALAGRSGNHLCRPDR